MPISPLILSLSTADYNHYARLVSMTRHFQLSSGGVVASDAVQPLLPISISEVPVGSTHEINTWASVKAACP